MTSQSIITARDGVMRCIAPGERRVIVRLEDEVMYRADVTPVAVRRAILLLIEEGHLKHYFDIGFVERPK